MDTTTLLRELRQQIQSGGLTMDINDVKHELYRLINQSGTQYYNITCIKCNNIKSVAQSEYKRISTTLHGVEAHICKECKTKLRIKRNRASGKWSEEKCSKYESIALRTI